MSMRYLYGVLEADRDPTPLTDLEGVGGSVFVELCGHVHLIHGPTEEEEILPRRRDLL